MRSGDINPDGPNETRIMLWILAQLGERYPEALWERVNVIVASTGTRKIKSNKKGSADIRGICQGLAFELEVKRPGETQTASQIKRQGEVIRAGGCYAVVHNPTEAFAVVDACIARLRG